MSDDPAIFLRQSPTAEGHQLTQLVDRAHDGASVPFWMFAEVCVRQARHGRWIGSMSGMYTKVRKYAKGGLALLLANLALIGGSAWHLAAETGAAAERAASQQVLDQVRREAVDETLKRLQHEIDELRADIRRLTGADQKSGLSIVQAPIMEGVDRENLHMLDSAGMFREGDIDPAARRATRNVWQELHDNPGVQ